MGAKLFHIHHAADLPGALQSELGVGGMKAMPGRQGVHNPERFCFS